MQALGLYLHIPFCRSKCLYCDFCSVPSRGGAVLDDYAAALCRELAARAEDCRGYCVDTVYFGGGTPTCLSPDQLLRILDCVFSGYHVLPSAEITLECNPATGSREGFFALRRGGFNRMSIGLQSTHAAELRALGRIHSFADFEATFSDARDAGFENLSVDLMSGIPHQTPSSYLASIARVAAMGPEHLSAYGLIVEEGTPFFRMQERLALPDEECARQMYFEGAAAMEAAGYRQYEISNFARPGYESRHNLKYWDCQPYLGFGPAAYSDFGGARFGNSRDTEGYLAGRPILAECERPSRGTRMQEYVMLKLRTAEGISARDFSERFGADFESLFGARLAAYEALGLTKRTECGVAFSREGLYVSNTILSELLDFSE